MTAPFRLVVDCRYVRRDGRHDGISRFSAGITAALGRLHPLTMLIDDPRQLALLPALPYLVIRPPAHPLEPLIPAVIRRRARPDVLYSPMQTTGSIGRRYGYVPTLHDLIYYRHRTPPAEFAWWVRLLWRLAYLSTVPQRVLLDRGDEVITVSTTTAAQIAEHRLTARRVTVVPNAADAVPLEVAAAGPRSRSLLYMGAFIGYKNVETLVRAAALLPEYELHLLSPVGDAVRRALQAVAPTARLRFHDGVTDAEYVALLDDAVALVTASRDEGFGIPVVEAMTRGVPVVLSDIPIFREVGGDAALYADPDDPASFAAAVLALERPGEWNARSRAALAQAAAFTWDASAARLLPVLQRVAAARGVS